MRAVESGLEKTQAHFRAAFRTDPAAAYRDWFRLQEELREREDTNTSRALAEDLWAFLHDLPFEEEHERARFFHNVAVFFGSPGPAAKEFDRLGKHDSATIAREHSRAATGS